MIAEEGAGNVAVLNAPAAKLAKMKFWAPLK